MTTQTFSEDCTRFCPSCPDSVTRVDPYLQIVIFLRMEHVAATIRDFQTVLITNSGPYSSGLLKSSFADKYEWISWCSCIRPAAPAHEAALHVCLFLTLWVLGKLGHAGLTSFYWPLHWGGLFDSYLLRAHLLHLWFFLSVSNSGQKGRGDCVATACQLATHYYL